MIPVDNVSDAVVVHRCVAKLHIVKSLLDAGQGFYCLGGYDEARHGVVCAVTDLVSEVIAELTVVGG